MRRNPRKTAGFTLLELMVALAIAGLLAALSAPAAMRMFDTMQYQGAVRDVLTHLASARYMAINTGRSVDMTVAPEDRLYGLDGRLDKTLPSSMRVELITAREVSSRDDQGVIRFYPDGGSSGGSILLQRRDSEQGVRLRVDWLLGRTTQEPLASE